MDFYNEKKEDLFLTDDDNDAFDFKYVSSNQFKRIIKDVRRERMKKQHQEVWSSDFVEDNSERSDCEEPNSKEEGMSMFKQLMRQSMEEVDQELERLKEDALPERKTRLSKCGSSILKNEQMQNIKKQSSELSQPNENPTKNADLLLTIPEELNSLAYERSPISKLKCSARKSHSEITLRSKSEASFMFRHSATNIECDYSSETSERYDSEADYEGESRVHPAAAHKILQMQKRVSLLLDEIAFRLGRIPLPDGDRDLRRRQQRVMEFAIRFSRNYLYDLSRQIGDIKRHMRAISPNARIKPTRRGISLHIQAIEQKLTSSHQLLLNALEAYCKHIPSSVLKGQPGKLKEILQVVVDLKDICTKIHVTTDYYECGDVEPPPLGNNTQKRCSAILSKLRPSSDNEPQFIIHTTQSTPIRDKRKKRRCGRIDNSKGLPNRLSMYSAEPRLYQSPGNQKAASTRLREKRVVAKKTIPEQHPSIPQQPNPSPVTCKSSKVIIKRDQNKIQLPQKEDEISTMMSTLATDSDAGSSVAVSDYSQFSVLSRKVTTVNKNPAVNTPSKISNALNTLVNDEPLIDDTTNGENRVTDEQLSGLVPVIADLMTLVKSQNDVAIRAVPPDSMDALMDLLKQYRPSKNSEIAPAERSTRTSSGQKIKENSQRLSRKSCEIRNRSNNMQLICVPSEENSRGTRDSLDVAARFCGIKGDEARNSIESSTTRKDSKMRVLTVTESSMDSLLKYRDDYESFSRLNPMYTSNSKNKPWEVVAWIADKLVEELIVDVAKEFQMEGVIRKLFELEFKEF